MSTRLLKYSLAAGLTLVLAAPAVAYSQYAARGQRFARINNGNAAPAGTLGAAIGQRGPRGFATLRNGGQARRGPVTSNGPRRFAGRNAGPRRGGLGRQGPGVRFDARFEGRAGRSGLAARALARGAQIGLSDDQREQISAAQRARREASIERRAAMRIAQLDLQELLQADSPDIAAVEAKMREVSEQRIAEHTEALRLNESVNAILTAEQRGQLRESGPGPGMGSGQRGRIRQDRPDVR